jgi:hypothetical protein
MNRLGLILFILLFFPVISYSQKREEGFKHKGYLGWMIDMSRNARTGLEWPSIIMDQALIDDYEETLDFLQRSRMNEITLWGLFTNSNWGPEIDRTIDTERLRKVREVISKAHQHGIKILCGLGVYSWGFNKIIKEHPEVKCPCNDEVLDPSKPESWEWQKRVLDYLTDNFDFDGFSMQSADRGRCTCGEYKDLSNLEYHALLNQKVVEYIRSKKKDYVIGISGWGMNFSHPADLKSIVSMTRNVDYLIDVEESALKGGKAYRQQLIKAITPCSYGSTATPNIEPIQALPRDQYFVPITKRSCQRIKELYVDGGRACETYVRTRGNIGDEVAVEVIASILNNPAKDIDAALKEILKWIFRPSDTKALQELVTIYNNAEDAYFTNAVGDMEVIQLMPRGNTTPSSRYLKNMSASSRSAYQAVMKDLYNRTLQLKDKIGNHQKYQSLIHCLETVLKEIELNSK